MMIKKIKITVPQTTPTTIALKENFASTIKKESDVSERGRLFVVEGVLLNPRTLKIYESTKFIFFLNCLNWERHNLGDRTRTPRHLSR